MKCGISVGTHCGYCAVGRYVWAYLRVSPVRRRVVARGGGQRQRRQVQQVLGAVPRQARRQRRGARRAPPPRARQRPLREGLRAAAI